MNIPQIIADELQINVQYVIKTIQLLEEGATVPFIARYRKELTGSMDDTKLRTLVGRLEYLRELLARKNTILKSIKEQQKLTPELEARILATDNKASLEDLYLPFKPKRRSKAELAKEAGLQPLSEQILNNPGINIEALANQYLNAEKNILSAKEALEGAKQILMEKFAENVELLSELRQFFWQHAILKSTQLKNHEADAIKFSDYFQYEEPLCKIPSHRACALFRGQEANVLNLNVSLTEEQLDYCFSRFKHYCLPLNNKNNPWLLEISQFSLKIKIITKLEMDSLLKLKEESETEAIKVFASNLKNLLMAAPAGSKITMGLDPGLRTGVKMVVVDETGKLLTYQTIFPHAPHHKWKAAIQTLIQSCIQFKVSLISIGNGTASRETDKLVSELKKQCPQLTLTSIVVSEAGASVYSASELAAKEFPDLDVSYRGAVSIARRLQDPLAELIKIDPKSIGVGQYQHDVNQIKLSRTLHTVLEDCVNQVGVDINTASIPLLSCVAGLNESIAKNIIAYRDEHGAFNDRQQLKKVPRLGEKAFEQAAGFLRIRNPVNPLDQSGVHPESYEVVEEILTQEKKSLSEMLGNSTLLKKINPYQYVNDAAGLPTILDILQELEKPGRDPRPQFTTACFAEGIESINDLRKDMILEGVITNVSNFGAFVDIGVHQDGLVHISMLSNHFVKDPHTIVKVGDIVKVKVIDIDLPRQRIQLSLRLNDSPKEKRSKPTITSTQKNTLSEVLTQALNINKSSRS